jgi:hypothetical protein
MRALLPAALLAAAFLPGLFACDQDYASSNSGRETFMGAVQASPPPSAPSGSATPLPPAPPPIPPGAVTAPPMPVASASAAPSASAAASGRPAPLPPHAH